MPTRVIEPQRLDQARICVVARRPRIQNDDIYHRFDDVMEMILLALTDGLPQD